MGISACFIFMFLYVYKERWVSKVLLVVPICYLLTSFSLSAALCNFKRIDYKKNSLIISEVLRSIYHLGIKKVEGISFVSDELMFSSQKTIIKNHPLLNRKIFNYRGLSDAWYANGFINGEYYMHKIVLAETLSDFSKSAKDIYIRCYTQTALIGVVLYIKTGSYCNSFPKNFNPGIY